MEGVKRLEGRYVLLGAIVHQILHIVDHLIIKIIHHHRMENDERTSVISKQRMTEGGRPNSLMPLVGRKSTGAAARSLGFL